MYVCEANIKSIFSKELKMTRFIRALFYSVILVLITINTACEELPCPNNNGIQVNMGIYKIENNRINEYPIDSFRIEYLFVTDTTYTEYYKQNTQTISLPLSQLSDTSGFVIKYKNSLHDTIMFISERTVKLISHECGFDTFFELKNINTTSNFLDSAWIKRETIDYESRENVLLYF